MSLRYSLAADSPGCAPQEEQVLMEEARPRARWQSKLTPVPLIAVAAVAACVTLVVLAAWCTRAQGHGRVPPGASGGRAFPLISELAEGDVSIAAEDVPMPPTPYSYDTFEDWFKAKSWPSSKYTMRPAWSWFGVDEALVTAKAWFNGTDMGPIAKVAKRINRFLFMRSIVTSGDDSSQASMPMHLLVLKLFQHDLVGKKAIRAVDIGCGTGWLLEAFRLMNNNDDSQIEGFDIDGVELARKTLEDPNAFSGTTLAGLPTVFHGDVLRDGFGVPTGKQDEVLPQHGFDVVNVGVGVSNETSAVFQRVAALVADGGAMAVPVCTEAAVDGKCKADFRLYRRSSGGQLFKEASGFQVKFVVPEEL